MANIFMHTNKEILTGKIFSLGEPSSSQGISWVTMSFSRCLRDYGDCLHSLIEGLFMCESTNILTKMPFKEKPNFAFLLLEIF